MHGLTEVAIPEKVLTRLNAPARSRLDSIDLLRGLVMVVMALDHVRDYFHVANFEHPPIDPMDLDRTTVALYLTRWITHYCAPTFVFLAGVGSFLFGSRGRTRRELSWFLFSRGLWLVLLEITLIRIGWSFSLDYHHFGPGVMWAIGWSMVGLSVLVYLPTWAVGILGIEIILFHNTFDSVTAAEASLPNWLWVILHNPGNFQYAEMVPDWLDAPFERLGLMEPLRQRGFETGYCVIPWLGTMASGYGLGPIFLQERGRRRRGLYLLGSLLVLAFVGIRMLNSYGNSQHWSLQSNALFTLFSFLDCRKYPPSLLYLLMTLGPALIALALFDDERGPIGRFFVVYGRVPLFYYLLHLPLIHGLVVALDFARLGSSPFLHSAPWTYDVKDVPDGYGMSLPVVYLIWICVVLALYPLCRWFADVKQRRRSVLLSYL